MNLELLDHFEVAFLLVLPHELVVLLRLPASGTLAIFKLTYAQSIPYTLFFLSSSGLKMPGQSLLWKWDVSAVFVALSAKSQFAPALVDRLSLLLFLRLGDFPVHSHD